MTDMLKLHEQAEAAKVEAERKHAELLAAQEAAHTERLNRRSAAWQQWADEYDPKALRRAAASTEAAWRADPTDLAKFGAFVQAAMTEAVQHSLRGDAATAGATLPAEDRSPASAVPFGMDGDGLPAMFFTAVFEHARQTTTAAADAARQAAQEAYESVDVQPPTHYRVVSAGRPGDTFEDVVGGGGVVSFLDGVAYVPAGLAAIARYYDGSDGYTVTPAYAVPSSHAELVARLGLRSLAAAPDERTARQLGLAVDESLQAA